ncbi:MAG: glycosyltransferase [Chloroflexi bacterium]|nr:glycosyltransferase [Chloroflexota bacterium]
MKIAYITQPYPPMISGASVVVQRLSQGMAARGHSVLVIAASDKGHSYTTQKGTLEVLRLASIPNPKRANQSFVLRSRKTIDDELKRFCPDILHVHDIVSMGVFGLLTAQTMNTPTVTTVHALPWIVTAYLPELPGLQKTVETSLWKYSRWLNKQCQTMVVPTRTIAEIIEARGGFKPIAITNGVDLQRFNTNEILSVRRNYLCEKYRIDPLLPIILHVGRLDTDKHVEIVIKAAARAMKNSSAQLLVVGDGEHRDTLMKLAQDLGIRNRSHFPGFVTPSGDLPELYRLSSVFTTASEIETQSLVLLEAIASGLPIVAVNATCIPELVIQDQNGFLVAPGNINELADALTKLIRNPTLANQMGISGRTIVREHSLTRSFDKHEELYRRLIANCQRLSEDQDFPKSFSNKEKSQNILHQPSGFKVRESKHRYAGPIREKHN